MTFLLILGLIYAMLQLEFFSSSYHKLNGYIVVGKPYSRTPKEYDGTRVTTHRMNDLIPHVLAKVGEVYQQRPDLILAAWPELIGTKLAGMTHAASFKEGVLIVNVKNSTLHSLLNQNEKPRLLRMLRGKFPQVEIRTIVFRIG